MGLLGLSAMAGERPKVKDADMCVAYIIQLSRENKMSHSSQNLNSNGMDFFPA